MRELTSPSSPPGWRPDTVSGARLVTVRDEGRLSCRGAWGGAAGVTVVAVNRHRPGGRYEDLYLSVGPDGVVEVLTEDAGVNPDLCAGPDGTPWVRMSLLVNRSDREPDTILPLRGRSTWENHLNTSEFAGDFVGWIGHRAFWHQDDIFDGRKPSRVQAVDLEADAQGPRLRARRPVRLPLPQSHDAVVCTDGTRLAVLALDEDPVGPGYLRIIDPVTLVVERELPVAREPDEASLTLARARSDGTALLYSVAADGRVTAIRLDSAGTRSTGPAGRLPGEPYSVWQVRGTGHHALRFTTEDTNGLLVLDGAAPVALWTGAPDRYRDTVGGREIPLGAGWGQPLLAAVAATGRSHLLVLEPEDNQRRLALLLV
ncbi:hypothetical protein [Streptomyces sp. NPDC018352]|uniref:hypothetical protein n=1 Tax=Streptomyces sp. NPDC018352 TaxID=3157194 RepID=UPI0033CDA95C